MGLMLGTRPLTATHKAASGTGVTARWLCCFCIASFCFGVLVVDRFSAIPDPVKIDQTLFEEKQQSREIRPVVKCEKKGAIEAGSILSQVSQAHEAIMTLDKTISSLEMQLAEARAAKADNEEGSPAITKSGTEQASKRRKVFFVMGIITAFSSRKRRDSIRETWMPQGEDLKKLEKEKGIVIRFVIGHSATPGGVLDRAIEAEEVQHKDFLRLQLLGFDWQEENSKKKGGLRQSEQAISLPFIPNPSHLQQTHPYPFSNPSLHLSFPPPLQSISLHPFFVFIFPFSLSFILFLFLLFSFRPYLFISFPLLKHIYWSDLILLLSSFKPSTDRFD